MNPPNIAGVNVADLDLESLEYLIRQICCRPLDIRRPLDEELQKHEMTIRFLVDLRKVRQATGGGGEDSESPKQETAEKP